ncbi:hypothetical protein ACKRLN_00255 [Anaerococcus sp. DFU013_CI05]|uniref:hypothetical protein n=1 Tax=Anaerococcus sp. AH8042_DFU013_CI05 TaxID=3385202 RepID=UPI003A521761
MNKKIAKGPIEISDNKEEIKENLVKYNKIDLTNKLIAKEDDPEKFEAFRVKALEFIDNIQKN